MRHRARVVGQVDPATLGVTELTGRVTDLRLDGVERLVLRDVAAEQISFAGVTLQSLTLLGRTRLSGCDFSGARLAHVGFDTPSDARLRSCDFTRCRFPSGVAVGVTRFERCTFATDLRGWLSYAGEFVNCSFTGGLDNCSFFGSPTGPWKTRLMRDRNVFEGNDFTRAHLLDCAFRGGIDPTRQQLPVGCYVISDTDALANHLLGRAQDFGLPESWSRSIETLMKMYRLFQAAGQPAVLVNIADFPPTAQSHRDEILTTLAALDVHSSGT